MHTLSLRPEYDVEKKQSFPSRLLRTLWRLQCPDEPLLETLPTGCRTQASLWYRSEDGFTGAIQHFESHYFARKAPIVVLLGPLLNPFTVLNRKLPWISELNAQGHSVYTIAHRCHTQDGLSQRPKAPKLDCSFASMVTEDVLSAIQMIEQHSGSNSVHLIGQGFGSWMTLLLMTLQDQRRIASVHLFNTPERLPSSLLSTILSFVHQETSMQQVWSRHLSAPKVPSLFKKLSLTERSALLHSNSWLSKDWLHSIRQNRTLKNLSLMEPIHLLNSLPRTLQYPLHTYKSESLASFSPIHESAVQNSISKSFFPLLHTDIKLNI